MKDIVKRLVARLAKKKEQSTERAPERLLAHALEIDTEQVLEQVVQRIQMQTIFPHPALLHAGDSYGDWYARVAGIWHRRRQADMQAAPTDDLQQVINSVMRSRLETAQAACTTLH
jgi:hypothetical protein